MATTSSVPEPSRAMETARLELARFAPDISLDRVFRRACELSASALDVERVGVWLFIDDRAALRCANLFERTKNEHSQGAVLRVADFPTYFKSLTIRKAIPAEVAASEPWTTELAAMYLRPLGIRSMLDAGIFVDGGIVGVVCHEHTGPIKEWTTEARDFAGSVADLLGLRMQSAQMRELRAAFLSQRKRLAALDKAQAFEELAAGIAHDFKNLLAVFLGHGEMLTLSTELPAETRTLGAEIAATAHRGVTLADELLAFARPELRPPAVIDIAVATSDLLPTLKAIAGSRHELRYSAAGGVGHVLIDESQYARLLMNLIVNAQEAMPAGGVIELRLATEYVTEGPSYTGCFVLVEVRDRGAGMDEATQRRIFEPFYTTKARGTGLGLAVVRQVTLRAGGLIRVDSAPGCGTAFRVFLPRIAASSSTASGDAPPSNPSTDERARTAGRSS